MSDKLPLIYCAVDTKDMGRAKELAAAMHEAGCGIKLGLEFFNAHGPDGVQMVRSGRVTPSLFLDLKFHDIPNTVAQAVAATAPLDAAFINVHASGGLSMMSVANSSCVTPTRLLAVTVLTSMAETGLSEVGQGVSVMDQVRRLARLTKDAGLAGVVCSAHEVATVRDACGPDFVTMVPGIRPDGSPNDDQSRTMTPRQAVDAGASHLVIGRPITRATDPAAAAREILASVYA